ncbi:MAG: potassium transporter TrkA [Halobacteriales archaeon SW_8_66_22]|nr:MAG: potassium transporter TrkA [Halobacteriales archaeon SW_8_66_22]
MVSFPRSLSEIQFSRRNRLVVYYFVGLGALILSYTVVYNLALSYLEGVNQSIFASLEFVIQTMTTTGYGQDSELWGHPLMFLFVSLTQVSGIAVGFFTLRLIIIPLFTGAEVNLDNRLTPKRDHVIICEYCRDSAVLLDELGELEIDYVLLSSSEEKARALSDDGYSAIHGSPQDAEALGRASIDTARAVITDAGDANVNTILTVRSLRPDVEIIALTDDSNLRDVLLETGADSVLSPHNVLGHRLAEKAVTSFSSELTDGSRIQDSNIRERTGANVIAAWIDGELQLPPNPDAVIRPNTVLLVSGGHDALEEISDFIRPTRISQHERIVLVGMGEVGQAAHSVVTEAGIDTVTIDIEDHNGVDIVADAGSEGVLREAGVENSEAVIVGLPDDSASLLTTVLARSLDPNIEILTRLSDTDATKKALNAGADYVLSVPRVSARMLAKELRGEDVLAPASQIRFVRVPAGSFAGQSLVGSSIYEKTGCRVIAIEDESGLTDRIDPTRELSGDEQLTVVGTDESIQRFLKQFDVSPTPATERSVPSGEGSD